MESVLEQQRKLHEERERLTDAVVKEFLAEKKTHKMRINSDHRVKALVDRRHEASMQLAELYVDADRARTLELEAVAGPNEFAEFYSRLKQLKEAHKRNPDEIAEPLSVEFQRLNEVLEDPDRIEKDTIEFTDEEGYGRFLDMHNVFNSFLNLKAIKRVDYVTYISVFDRFADIPRQTTKKTGAYKEYLQLLEDYLRSFVTRTRPLFEMDDEMGKAEQICESSWNLGTLAGWESTANKAGVQASEVDLAEYQTAADLEALGLERLKGALQAMGLKCGGTLKERSERLFATKGHRLSELEKKALMKKDGDKEQQREKRLAQTEARCKRLADLLSEEREATKENVERKQARAAGEIDDEEEEDVAYESEEEVDDSVPYNPKNLPLGWDGKPIPYWLYKLHGLNLSYSCEICGNQKYKGPKAFQRHFNEWRHSHGMRCLGIPNTAHFANITKIADALELWNKMKVEKEEQKWDADVHEEFEDSKGNVVNRRTYEDLKRQGLL